MRISISFFSLLFFLSFTTKAQKEASNWMFGVNAGISFHDSTFSISHSALNSLEGISSISDKNGNLLFYSDGTNVYNRYHQIMPNGSGLLGHWSSTQSCIAVPKPGTFNIYYLFTSDAASNSAQHFLTNGYRYSEINMDLENGLGDVTSEKNILLFAPSTEKLCAVRHANGIDYWVLTHEMNSSKFKAYLVDCNGVNPTPVSTNVGVTLKAVDWGGPNLSYMDAIGQMKFSPNGRRIVMVVTGSMTAQLFDFDNSNGKISNPQTLKSYWTDGYVQPSGIAFDFENLYGAEFSPNNNVLYLSTIDYGYLYQYNLLNTSDVSSTGLAFWVPNVNGASFGSPGSLQLAPNNKIYQASKGFFQLNVINNPDSYGLGLGYTFSPSIGNNCNYGLPNFIASYFDSEFLTYTTSECQALFKVNVNDNLEYSWNFGDPYSDDDVSTEKSPYYTYKKGGNYTVTLLLKNSNGCTSEITKDVTINCVKDIFIPNLITPDSNHLNDHFEITNLDLYPNNRLKIFNRWGTLIYEANNYKNNWDGSDAIDGVYYYELEIFDLNKKWNGTLSIVR